MNRLVCDLQWDHNKGFSGYHASRCTVYANEHGVLTYICDNAKGVGYYFNECSLPRSLAQACDWWAPEKDHPNKAVFECVQTAFVHRPKTFFSTWVEPEPQKEVKKPKDLYDKILNK